MRRPWWRAGDQGILPWSRWRWDRIAGLLLLAGVIVAVVLLATGHAVCSSNVCS